jgi:hypothetical protein
MVDRQLRTVRGEGMNRIDRARFAFDVEQALKVER